MSTRIRPQPNSAMAPTSTPNTMRIWFVTGKHLGGDPWRSKAVGKFGAHYSSKVNSPWLRHSEPVAIPFEFR
jgi:hypothetical protein